LPKPHSEALHCVLIGEVRILSHIIEQSHDAQQPCQVLSMGFPFRCGRFAHENFLSFPRQERFAHTSTFLEDAFGGKKRGTWLCAFGTHRTAGHHLHIVSRNAERARSATKEPAYRLPSYHRW